MNSSQGRSEERPNSETLDKLLAITSRRTRQLRRTALLPLHVEGSMAASLRSGAPISGELRGMFGGEPLVYPFELQPPAEPSGAMRLSVTGTLPGEPLCILLGKGFAFWSCQPAVGLLSLPETPPVGLASDSPDELAVSTPLVLAADDEDDEEETLPSGKSADVAWEYEARRHCLAVEASAPAERAEVLVALEFKSLADPQRRRVRLERLRLRAGKNGPLKQNIFDLDLDDLGSEVELTVGPVRLDDPRHVHALLAQEEFVSLPVTVQADGSLSCELQWDDQREAAADPATSWVLQVALPGKEG